MKGLLLAVLISFLLVGCMDPWWEIGGSSDDSSGSDSAASSSEKAQSDHDRYVAELVNANPECPNGEWDVSVGKCICDQGYSWNGVTCAKAQCVFDRDCGTGGCYNSYTKIMNYCDIRTSKCKPPVYVNCRNEYGENYVCKSGNCVPG